MFCPKCSSLMFPSGGILVCRQCGYEAKPGADSKTKVRQEMKSDTGLLIVDGKNDTLPKTDVRCPRCGNNEAYWVLRQTRAADEPETRIYRCTKCGYSWREY
ncbi:MAG: transcription factor S [Methanomassiliicoccales archaeon]